MVRITRFSLNRCRFTYETSLEKRAIKSSLSVFNEGAIYSDIYREGKWDGYNRFYDKDNEFSFGLIEELQFNLKECGIKYVFIDDFNTKRLEFNESYLNPILYYYQKESVQSFFKNNIGIIIVPTRGGKTFISSEIMRIAKNLGNCKNFLFIVDTVDLFDQTRSEIAKYLKIDESEIGYINDKGYEFKQFNIGMIQSMVSALYFGKFRTQKGKKIFFTKDQMKIKRKKKRDIEKFLRDLEFLVVDEIQEFSSTKRLNVLKKCKNLNFKLGLSATPFKQIDSLIENMKIKEFFGRVAYEIKGKNLQEGGFLSTDKIILLNFDHSRFKYPILETYQEKLKYHIQNNKARNDLICDFIEICKARKWKTLVIFNFVKHGNIIAKRTGVNFIHGGSKKSERNEQKELFLKNKGGVLIASNIWKKGITLPEAEIMVLADGGLEGSTVIQKRGRVLGATKEKKHSAIVDIMDVNSEYFSDHSLNRLEVYLTQVEKENMEVHDLKLDEDKEDLVDSLKDWLNEK